MHQSPAAHFAFPALILANLFLAAGPWMVRLADVGPVAAGFWRLALAIPFLAWLGWRQGRGQPFPGWTMVAAVAVGGVFFAADLAAWHAGILRTTLANATLFGNFASFLFALYGFILLRTLPGPCSSARWRWPRSARCCCSATATKSARPTSTAICSPCSPASSTRSI